MSQQSGRRHDELLGLGRNHSGSFGEPHRPDELNEVVDEEPNAAERRPDATRR
jgi:hypothetical protein